MNLHVLDTSVAVAWYFPETFSPSARVWQDSMLSEDVRFLVPDQHFLEFGNVLRSYVVRKVIDSSFAQEVYSAHMAAPLRVVNPAKDRLLDVALAYNCTTYDASYIALALDQRVALITAERTTTPWVAKLGKLAIIVK